MKRFAVMGNPIAHSLSPIIHQHFAKQANIALVYDKLLVALDAFAPTVHDFFAQGGSGLNITAPFKEQAFALANTTTARCAKARAANVLWMEDDKLCADNSDGAGLVNDLQRHLVLANSQVLILGAGGATRGIIAPLLASKVHTLTLSNRTMARALELQKEFPTITCVAPEALAENYDLILHATSAQVNQEAMLWPSSIFHTAKLAYDLSYALQKPTPFVQWALQQGVTAIDGLGMLVEQAAIAFKQWHGFDSDTATVIEKLRRQC